MALETLTDGFNAEILQLNRCFALRNVDLHDQTNIDALSAAHEKVSAVEEAVAGIKAYLDREQTAVNQAKALLATAQAQKQRLDHMKENLPDRLPGKKASKAEPVQSALAPANPKAAKSKAKSRKAVAVIKVPTVDPVLVGEFNAVPKYLRGRLAREQVNVVADAVYEALKAKYKILSTPRAKLGDHQMQKYSAFKLADHDGVEGALFLVEDDLRTLASLKLDSANRTSLTILRHLGRIKEHRAGGFIRYVLV